jgi:hypothetical protein
MIVWNGKNNLEAQFTSEFRYLCSCARESNEPPIMVSGPQQLLPIAFDMAFRGRKKVLKQALALVFPVELFWRVQSKEQT